MNQTITIENFKCFAEKKRIDLGGITVCAGMNSVGKSSLIQSFLLVRQIFDAAGFYRDTAVRDYEIRLNGVYGLQLGDSQRIKSSMDKDDIFIYIDDIRFRLCSIPDKPMQLTTENMYSLQELEERQGIFSKRFYYLNAERQGPRKYQDITGSDDLGCGIHGENTFHLLREREIDRIEEGRMFPFDKGKRVNTVGKQVEYWMNYIIPGVELNVKELNDLGISQLEVRQQVFDTGFMSPCNFGFGISYVLPIVLSGLLAEKQGMLIIENPEAHLHPAGQSRIGYFLAMMAKAGVQIILETHSEHVINGIRIAALQLEMETEDICINYFSIDHEKGEHRVERIELNERMDLLKWPDGFLDQEEQDLRRLRELRRKN